MCILFHNNRVSISGNIIYFRMFCLNTGTKFREPYHLNHMIPRLEHVKSREDRILKCISILYGNLLFTGYLMWQRLKDNM